MKKGSKKPLWLLLFLIVAAVGLHLYTERGHMPASQGKIEKTGARVVVDYTATSRRIHTTVDQALAAGGLTGRDMAETSQETAFPAGEGLVRWQQRQLLVLVPANLTLESVRQLLAARLAATGTEVLTAEADNYHGWPAQRLDIGLRETLEGVPVTIITDMVYLSREKPAAPGAPASAGVRGRLALIIDDFGYSEDPIAAFAAIARPLTFSVLPNHPYSNVAAAQGLSSGHQVMLHLPMEPLSATAQQEDGTITVNMSDDAIKAVVTRALQAVPGIQGVNNHQGSRATADARVMRDVLTVLKKHNMFFVDSRTNSQSVAYDLARQLGVAAAENELFIDHNSDISQIKARLREAGQLAVRYGRAVAIGHARLNTAQAVREVIPELEATGVQLVFVSQLVH